MTPKQAIELATKNGYIEIAGGVYLSTLENLQADQLGWSDEDSAKKQQLSGAPFWITTDSGYIEAIHGADDEDLFAALSN